MSVTDGQKADATNFNAAYLSKDEGGTTLGIIDLFNSSDPDSGARVLNAQQAINELFDAVGMTGIGDLSRKNYSSTSYVSNGDSHKAAIGKLDNAILGISTISDNKLDKPGVSTTHGLARFPDTAGIAVESTGVTVSDTDDIDVPGDAEIHGDLIVDGIIITSENLFAIANDVVAQNVTGLLFNKAVYRAWLVEYVVYRKSTGGGGQIRTQSGSFRVVHDDTNISLTEMPKSGQSDAGVTLDANASTGQITYSSDDNGGTPDTAYIKYSIVKTFGV